VAIPHLYRCAETAYHVNPVHVRSDSFNFFCRDRGDYLQVEVLIKLKDFADALIVHAVEGFVKNHKAYSIFRAGFIKTIEACGNGYIVWRLGFAAGFFFENPRKRKDNRLAVIVQVIGFPYSDVVMKVSAVIANFPQLF
jgi:hypothetical protein